MSNRKKVISLEFNELCPSLMHRFMDAGELPNFRRFYREAEVFVTDAEERGELLNPWVQWITVHTGLSAEEHGVTTLSEGHKVASPAIWDVLSAAGRRVWICGSMNTRYDRPINGFLLPDPWSTGTCSYPAGEFDDYLAFVRSAVQEHTSGGGGGSANSFLRFMLTHGLSLSTVLNVIGQLAEEKMSNARWKRAVLLDRFQWDLFKAYYRRFDPDYSTFFLNSTAHFQHCYWRNMEPDKFVEKPSPEEQRTYSNAILYGYQRMDRLVGRFMKLAGNEATLVFCTAMSQQPYLDHESSGGRHYYRLIDKAKLRSHLGLKDNFAFEPVMAEQFYLRFEGDSEADEAFSLLSDFVVRNADETGRDERRLFHMARKPGAIMMQCNCTELVGPRAVIACNSRAGVSLPFYEVFYKMEATKSGRHHPDGMLWIRGRERLHHVSEGRVSIREIAPRILRMFDLTLPRGSAVAVEGASQ